ncbi:hypothetical protein PV516_18585 [Streptomyces scabiei]|uniref:hypothetical protein n=1 Tax=Streptomyces scabiei TaxID=1930 RepID=UPI0029ACF071|nr:hypothetical protein [Streptomyces scabiei]MDX3165793.1 hypothetical protein [Streptomyces scabiei]
MTSTFTQATARLRTLLEGLEEGLWEPSSPERTCAAVILTAAPRTSPVDAVLGGMRAAGPDIAPAGETNVFAAALVESTVLLRGTDFPTSKEGQQLLADLNALLNGIIVAPAPSSWARWTGRAT